MRVLLASKLRDIKFPAPPVCDHPERPDGKPLCQACFDAWKPSFDAWAKVWKKRGKM